MFSFIVYETSERTRGGARSTVMTGVGPGPGAQRPVVSVGVVPGTLLLSQREGVSFSFHSPREDFHKNVV